MDQVDWPARYGQRFQVVVEFQLTRREACYWLYLRWLTENERHPEWVPPPRMKEEMDGPVRSVP